MFIHKRGQRMKTNGNRSSQWFWWPKINLLKKKKFLLIFCIVFKWKLKTTKTKSDQSVFPLSQISEIYTSKYFLPPIPSLEGSPWCRKKYKDKFNILQSASGSVFFPRWDQFIILHSEVYKIKAENQLHLQVVSTWQHC